MSKKKQDNQANQVPGEDKWKKFAEEQATDSLMDDEGDTADDLASVVDEEPESMFGEAAEAILGGANSELQTKLAALEKKNEAYREEVIRANAEMDNVRKRAERDVSNARKYANEKILVELLPVVDSLVRGLEGEELSDGQAKAVRDGMRLTLDLLEKTLEKFGVEAIAPAVGEVFNPEVHEAMSMQPSEEAASGTVLQVLQKGYQLNGRVIRAAMVIVAQ